MSKKYLITKVIVGEKQDFLKNVTKDGGEWINDHNEALTFLNLEDAENEKGLSGAEFGLYANLVLNIRTLLIFVLLNCNIN